MFLETSILFEEALIRAENRRLTPPEPSKESEELCLISEELARLKGSCNSLQEEVSELELRLLDIRAEL